MTDTGGDLDVDNAAALTDLGVPPSNDRDRAAWLRRRFVEVGCVWYAVSSSDRDRQQELEDLAVALLAEHRDVLPSLSTLKREVANWSFLPSTVENLWSRAFPPSAADRGKGTVEWTILVRTESRIADLRRSGQPREAEALRAAAVTFLNKYLSGDEVGEWLRTQVRQRLRKV